MSLFFGFNQKKKPVENRKIDKKFEISGLFNNDEILTLEPEAQEIVDTTPLQCGEELGKGVFGTAHLCTQDGEDGEKFVLKTIKLSHLKDAAAKHAFMRLVKREVSALKKLGMLKGFKKTEDAIYILMPHIEGTCLLDKFREKPDNLKSSAVMIKEALAALKDLHDQGIAHMDAHMGNMIVGDEGNVTPIDFGFAVETNYHLFFKLDEARLVGHARQERALRKENNILERMFLTKLDQALWGLYIEETLQYIREHKLETALKVLTYGIVSIAAMHGLASYQVARIMAWSLGRMLLQDYGSKYLFFSLKMLEAGRGFPDLIVDEVNIGKIQRVMGNIFSQILPVVIMVQASRDIYDNKESVYLLYNIATAVLTGNPQAVYAVLKKIDIEQAFNVALLYFPIHRMPSVLANLAEEHLTTVDSLNEDCKKIAFSP